MLNEFDKKYLLKTIEIAKKTHKKGNFPVGAIITIDNKIIVEAGNERKTSGSVVSHAENLAIIRSGKQLAKAYEEKNTTCLYTTLEPCLQCLGAAMVNRIGKICYIQKDPNGGACDIRHDNIGLVYREFWPEITHAPISDEPKKIMTTFFHEEIKRGNVEWPSRMLQLIR